MRGARPPRGALVLSARGAPNLHVRLQRPVVARGLYGLRREADELWLRCDDPEALRAALATLRRLDGAGDGA